MKERNNHNAALLFIAALIIGGLIFSGCARTSQSDSVVEQTAPENTDLSCSYFYFLWGTHAEFEGRYEEAAEAYQKALVCDPSARYIMHKLPLLHLKNGNMNEAVAMLSKNVADDPEDTASRMLLARLYVQQKKYKPAINQYRAVLASEPEHEQALLRLGILLDQTGEPAQARSKLTALLKLYPESYVGTLAMARISESYDESAAYYERALELNRSIELYYETAQFFIDEKKYDRAVELISEALKDDRENEQARMLLALSLLGAGNEEAAVVELSLLPQYRNNPVQLTMVLSKLYVRLNEHELAIDHLQELLAAEENSAARYLLGVIYSDIENVADSLKTLEPIGPEAEEFEDAVFLRAKMLHQSGKIDQALQMMDTYVSTDATARPIFYVVQSSLYKDSDREIEALDTIKKGFTRYPDNEKILFEYGLQLERSGQTDEAIAVMERLLMVKPDHAEALNFVGYTWADTNRHLDKALDYIARAVELRPGNGYIQDSLGWVHFRLGNLERARDELLYAIELLPEDPHINDHLGDVYRALKDSGKAKQYYRQALRYFEEDDKKNQMRDKIDALR